MFYGQHIGFGAGGDEPNLPLIDILTNLELTTGLKLCLDAGDANSYTSGQQWLDTSGGGYDFDFGTDSGASTDDPTFNGVAGGLSSAEYMSFDGGDYFEYETTIATWMNTLHKNNAKFSWFIVYYSTGAGNGTTFATASRNATPGVFYLADDGLPQQHMYIHNNATHEFNGGGAGTVTADVWNMLGGSIDEGGGNVSHWWLNGAVDFPDNTTDLTFDASLPNPATDTANNFRIGARNPNDPLLSQPAYMPNGDRIAAFAFWQGSGLLTTANFNSIRTKLLGRGF